jgi:hypothetical protein
MPPVGFEPQILTGERPKTYALDRAATGTGSDHALRKFNPLTGPIYDSPCSEASQEIPRILRTPSFIKAFESARQLSLPTTRSFQSIPHHPTSQTHILTFWHRNLTFKF